ncbi:MAG: hypothetical protein WBA54_15825 [Acidaminobacteraceae bacterium]
MLIKLENQVNETKEIEIRNHLEIKVNQIEYKAVTMLLLAIIGPRLFAIFGADYNFHESNKLNILAMYTLVLIAILHFIIIQIDDFEHNFKICNVNTNDKTDENKLSESIILCKKIVKGKQLSILVER